MGLTVEYSIHVPKIRVQKARKLVNAMRQICLDLPFQQVGEIVEAMGDKIEKYYASTGIQSPWNVGHRFRVHPTHLILFDVDPGEGCETATFGLCIYPTKISVEYQPQWDSRYQKVVKKDHSTTWYDEVDDYKWLKYCKRKWGKWHHPDDSIEQRVIRTKLTGWNYSGFCKTQYASDPKYGGIPNFLRCHISLITALERFRQLDGVQIEIDDEGKYGPSRYSDDYKEAYAANREPTYVWHDGLYSPKKLIVEIGEWNQMTAAFMGAFLDVAEKSGIDKQSIEVPITKFANFENLELRGQQDIDLFLQVISGINKPDC